MTQASALLGRPGVALLQALAGGELLSSLAGRDISERRIQGPARNRLHAFRPSRERRRLESVHQQELCQSVGPDPARTYQNDGMTAAAAAHEVIAHRPVRNRLPEKHDSGSAKWEGRGKLRS